jgi:hypothetical protein
MNLHPEKIFQRASPPNSVLAAAMLRARNAIEPGGH